MLVNKNQSKVDCVRRRLWVRGEAPCRAGAGGTTEPGAN